MTDTKINDFSNKGLKLIQDTLAKRFDKAINTERADHVLKKNTAEKTN